MFSLFSKNSKFYKNFLKVLSFLELAAHQTRYYVQKIKKTLFKPLSDLITFLFELQLSLSFQYVITQCFRIWIHLLSASNSSYYFRYRDSCKTCLFWRSNLVDLAVHFLGREREKRQCFMSGTQHINRVHIIFYYSYFLTILFYSIYLFIFLDILLQSNNYNNNNYYY